MRFSLVTTIAAAVFAVLSPVVPAAEITIRADEWLPYNGPASRTPPGYMIEAAQRIAEANGHTINYSTMPWDDAVAAVREGRFDCVVGALKSDAEGFAFPANAWGRSTNAFFSLDDKSFAYRGIDSLAGQRVAVIEGYSYGDELDAYIEQHRADPARIVMVKSSGRAAMNAISRLVTGKADLFIEDANVGHNTIGRLQLVGRVVERGAVAEPDDLYIACTPADPRGRTYADMFSEGIAALRASGELNTILATYSLSDWESLE